jgi:hypothetical protein
MEKQFCCPIVEYRQYTLHPGKRDALIGLFDRELIEGQEALGMKVIGQFRDADNPDLFVWLRGFTDMNARTQALEAFYGGPVWMAHREAANATMLDYSNVLLLHPSGPESGFSLGGIRREPPGRLIPAKGLVVVTTCHFRREVNPEFAGFFHTTLAPVLTDSGASVLASFVTETSVNSFPTLPVREGERVFVWFSLFRDLADYDRHVAVFVRSALYRDGVWDSWKSRFRKPMDIQKLLPTPRSLLRG